VSVRGVRTRAPARARVHGIADLAVMVQFDDLVVAIPAQRVARIVLADEATDAAGARIRIGDHTLPAYDLAHLLGLGHAPAAYLVLGAHDGHAEVALASGPCIAIAAHGPLSRLPRGILTDTTGGVLGVFSTDPSLRGRGGGPRGVRVDPRRLIGAAPAARWGRP
jgi:hypothetical protein